MPSRKQVNPFQSTHSLRSATKRPASCSGREPVSIHALLAECDIKNTIMPPIRISFNPRTPCGVRLNGIDGHCFQCVFQSTHSLRSATNLRTPETAKAGVSIHALLAECDQREGNFLKLKTCFNPRTPCGVRRDRVSAGRAIFQVSIHALLAECDGLSPTLSAPLPCFNPRTPCGVRRIKSIILTEPA